MSQHLAELCKVLISNAHGDISAQIFSTLAEHGRLTLQSLAQHIRVPPRRLRHTLGLLLEQQLVLRYAASDDAPGFYSVDWRNAYGLVRQDNIVKLVNERYGEGAGRLVANILQLGSARVGDLTRAVDTAAASKRDSGAAAGGDGMVNGVNKPHEQKRSTEILTASQLHATLRTLLKSGILVKITSRAYIPNMDLQEQIEETVKSSHFPDGKVTGPKKQAEFKAAVNNLKRNWREDDGYSDHRDLVSKGAGPASKRTKLTNGNHAASTVSDDMGPILSNDLIVHVNQARCTLALRSQRLRQMAKRVLGPVTAAVYGALLQALEAKCLDPRDDEKFDSEEDEEAAQPIANVKEVFDILDQKIDLTSVIKGLEPENSMTNGTAKKRKKPDDEFADIGIKREDHSDDDDRGLSNYRDQSKRMGHIEAHLSLLEEHSSSFCRRVRAHGGQNEWRVHFPEITSTVIQAEVDATISARFGKTSLRVVRMLREKGKLDEKQLSSRAMMRIKEVRGILTQLQFHGFLEAQELPKDNSRQPSRTIFLWFIDDNRVRSNILDHTHKAMTRTLQRINAERKDYQPIISKAARTDVKDQEQKKLEAGEKQHLREWREREERLYAQVARMDDVVTLFREFSTKDISLLS